MIKHYCNLCGLEIAKDDVCKAHLRCYKLHITDWAEIHLHTACMEKVLGAEAVADYQQAYEECKKRGAARKAAKHEQT